ncbi:hypothetical protein D3C86_1670780 [compost metagenome]
MYSGGWRVKPTPGGVPVTITSPAWSVSASLIKAIKVATSKIISSVQPSCTIVPFKRVCTRKPLPPADTSSGVTR